MTEDKIREALFAIADRAPHPVRVTAGLANRRRAHRQRRALLAMGAAGAVAVTAGGAAALTRLRSTGPDTGIVPPGGATPSPSASPTPPPGALPTPSAEPSPKGGNTFVPMKYRPTWLPEGVVERQRQVTLSNALSYGPDQQRSWDDAGQQSVYLYVERDKPKRVKGSTPVTIRGREGWLSLDDGNPGSTGVTVVWPEDATVWLTVAIWATGDTDLVATATRIAESVVPDGITGCEVFAEFGWLPAGLRGVTTKYQLDPSPDGAWSASLWADTDEMGVDVWIGPQVDLQADTEPVTVRGRPGKKVLFTYPNGGKSDHGKVFVDLGPVGLSLSSMSKIRVSLDDLVRIADDMRIGPNPYLGWTARR